MQEYISGIQQIGIGIPNVYEAFNWYNKNFGIDVQIFDEAAEAKLMLPYTGGKPQKRHAILALNMKGGGGFEIWQYTSRTPQPASFPIQLGDLGVYAAKLKSENIEQTFKELKNNGAQILNDKPVTVKGEKLFYVKDLYGNIFQLFQGEGWFGRGLKTNGGTAGVLLGVSDMERSIKFYKSFFGYDKIIFDEQGVFEDFKNLPNGDKKCRRVLLTHTATRKGPFSRMFGQTYIELVQVFDYTPKKMFENRFWGDLGFIHLSFDVINMKEVKKFCEANGHPFTVDSGNDFSMGDAGGHFSYIEDPDGYWIEFVETHKVPIFKKIGWYLDLRKRNREKPLPNWMVKSLSLNRKKVG